MNQKNQNHLSWIKLGVVTKPFGLKGEFEVALYNRQESSLKADSKIYMAPMDAQEPKVQSDSGTDSTYTIEKISFRPKKVVMKLLNVDHINEAEKLLPFALFIPQEDLPTLTQGEYYYHQLKDLKVIEESSQKVLGRVTEVYEVAGQTNLTIAINDPAHSEVFDLPFLPQFFPQVDLEAGTIIIILPEFLEVKSSS